MIVDNNIVDDVEDDALLQDDFEHEGADDVDDGLLQDEELAPTTPGAEFSLTTPVGETALKMSAHASAVGAPVARSPSRFKTTKP